MISLSALQNIADIFEFFKSLGSLFENIFSFLPSFLAPLAIAYITLSLIYFIAGRG